MHLNSKWPFILMLLTGSMAAHAGTVVYDFTGVVTNVANASGISVGERVTGTFSFIYNGKDHKIGSLGYEGAPWVIGSSGIPYNPVFASKIKIGGALVYESSTSAPNSDPDDASSVTGTLGTFTAAEATPAFDMYSYFTIESGDGTPPFTGEGVPTAPLSTSDKAAGGLLEGAASITFKIRTLTLATVPSVSNELEAAE